MTPRLTVTGTPRVSRLNSPGHVVVSVPEPSLKVAVVITCHNYGHYLASAIESVQGQTVPPAEVVVIDDASTDNTVAVAKMFDVPVISVDHCNLLRSRMTGMDATTAPLLCFLDADDMLSGDYLEKGAALFRDPTIGAAWSDMQEFGYSHNLRVMNPIPLTQDNFMHAGSIVRRTAIELSGLAKLSVPNSQSEDWLMWRLLERDRWKFLKNPAIYHYRRHKDSMSHVVNSRVWQEVSPVRFEKLTLFIPLSGRTDIWPALRQFLDHQTFDRTRISLFLCDTSNDQAFHRNIRKWVEFCDYDDVRLMRLNLDTPPNLSDANRRLPEIREAVRLAVAKIYRMMIRETTDEFLWIIEDDVIPPLDAADKLLSQFDRHVMSVSGCYRSPYADRFTAWIEYGNHIETLPDSPIEVGGNGFGCVIIRRQAILEHGIQHAAPTGDYDINLYANAAASHWKAILHPGVVCDHLFAARAN